MELTRYEKKEKSKKEVKKEINISFQVIIIARKINWRKP